MTAIHTIAVLLPLPEAAVTKLRSAFRTVHYHPSKELPTSVWAEIEMLFTSNLGVPDAVKSMEQLTKLRHVQLASAGADKALAAPAMQDYIKCKGDGITLSTASGTHVLSIPNYVVANVINLYHQLNRQIIIANTQAKWDKKFDEGYYARKTWGRTAGMLGYGALGRETARLLKAHGMRIIAANTSGKASKESEYVIPGTGDKDGSIPEAYFSTKSPDSFDEFLKQADVLVCSLPSTPATHYLLTKEKLALLPKHALLINIGRGDLVRSADLLDAVESGHLFGAAVDVTDPEPLPEGHALFKHPRVIVTPHLSGDTEGEFDIATDIAIANAKRIDEGKAPYNVVDYTRGY